jgi:hypothetical protein
MLPQAARKERFIIGLELTLQAKENLRRGNCLSYALCSGNGSPNLAPELSGGALHLLMYRLTSTPGSQQIIQHRKKIVQVGDGDGLGWQARGGHTRMRDPGTICEHTQFSCLVPHTTQLLLSRAVTVVLK